MDIPTVRQHGLFAGHAVECRHGGVRNAILFALLELCFDVGNDVHVFVMPVLPAT